ncbi:MAG: hypothetical protein IJ447_05710 [Clostridia bacterium]|nr:hypothetical protein [Clostridia bacterium]
MNPEDLCKKMQEEKKADSENYYEEEMSSHEYLGMYFGTKYFSNKKFLRLVQEERRQINESKRLYYYGGK